MGNIQHVSTNVQCIYCMPSYKIIMHAGKAAHADSLGHTACQLDKQIATYVINDWENSQSICSVRLWRRHIVPAMPDASLGEGVAGPSDSCWLILAPVRSSALMPGRLLGEVLSGPGCSGTSTCCAAGAPGAGSGALVEAPAAPPSNGVFIA